MYILASILLVLVALAFFTLSRSHYDYGVMRDAPSLKYGQTDPYYIKGKYEFQSILFKSADNSNLVVTLQHPIHPLPEPETYISQIGFNLTQPEAQALIIKKVSLVHLDAKGEKVQPKTTFTIPDKLTKETRFYVNTYSRSALTPTLTEVATVIFEYQGELHEISFREKVHLVKRWNKLLAGLGI